MARHRDKERKDRWYLPRNNPYFNLGYCLKRFDSVHIFVNPLWDGDTKAQKSLNLPWSLAHKERALDMLSDYISQKYQARAESEKRGGDDAITSTDELFEKFALVNFGDMHKKTISYYYLGWKTLVPENMPLNSLNDITELCSKQLSKKVYAPATYKRRVEATRSIFQFAVEQGWIRKNPVPTKLKPKVKTEVKYAPTEEEVSAALKYFYDRIDDPDLHVKPSERVFVRSIAYLLTFLTQTGCRIFEALDLKWTDCSDRFIYIHGKGGFNRHFPVKPFPELDKLFKEMKKNNHSFDGYLFPWRNRTHPAKQLRKYLLAIKHPIKNMYSFHGFRRYVVEKFVRDKRFDIEVVSDLLGHSVDVMREHYLRILGPERLEEYLMERRKNVENTIQTYSEEQGLTTNKRKSDKIAKPINPKD